MFHAANLPDDLPVFPLPGALLLPRSRLPLHIFEPRYLAMLDDTLKTSHRLIGMIQPVGGAGDDNRLHTIGCAGRITGFSETQDGRYMVNMTGISRFRTISEFEGFTPYRRFHVDWADFGRDLGQPENDTKMDRATLLAELNKYFELEELSTDWKTLEQADDELLINSLSMLCPFETEDKQALLESPSLETRRETLVTLIEFALRQKETGGRMQ